MIKGTDNNYCFRVFRTDSKYEDQQGSNGKNDSTSSSSQSTVFGTYSTRRSFNVPKNSWARRRRKLKST